jgi:hypothetical protein
MEFAGFQCARFRELRSQVITMRPEQMQAKSILISR